MSREPFPLAADLGAPQPDRPPVTALGLGPSRVLGSAEQGEQTRGDALGRERSDVARARDAVPFLLRPIRRTRGPAWTGVGRPAFRDFVAAVRALALDPGP